MIVTKSSNYNGKSHQGTIEFKPEVKSLNISNDRQETMEEGTRYYIIDGKKFDADIYDKNFGVGNPKAKILPQNTKDPNFYMGGYIPSRPLTSKPRRTKR